jgi:hypothetical protein
VYNLLGIRAQESFVQSWLVALGLDNATQWKEIAKEAWKGGLFIIIMDRLWLQSNRNWCARTLLAGRLLLQQPSGRALDVLAAGASCCAELAAGRRRRFEDQLDWLTFQATMMTGETMTRWQILKQHLHFFAYVQDV